MKTALINLPYKRKIVRRYTCTYYASNFLFPPLELMYLAAIVREWKKAEACLIDAVAQQLDWQGVVDRLKSFDPQVLVFLLGIETFSSDVKNVEKIRVYFPSSKVVCFGYYPTIFPHQILKEAPFVDFILMGEPEMTFSLLYDKIQQNRNGGILAGTAFREGDQIKGGMAAQRIKDLDILPFPARDLVVSRYYKEFFCRAPLTTMQFSRGCPSACTYCVRTFGQKVGFRSIQNLMGEIREVINRHKIKVIRFMDDDFCINRHRVEQFCAAVIKEKLKFQWICLSRVDHLEQGLLSLMKRAGCKRIYLGVETFSKRILDYYKKDCVPEEIFAVIKMIKKARIEAVGLFMVGGIQTRQEFEEDIKLARSSGLDYIGVGKITAYPGTPFYEQKKQEIDFSLFPYTNRLKDVEQEKRICEWEKEFYRKFYLGQGYLLKTLKQFLFYPQDALIGLKALLVYSPEKADSSQERTDLI